jgi:predicted transcriptional regulator
MLQSVCGKPPVTMRTITAKVDDALLERIQRVCKWESKTQEQLVRSALEDKIKPYKKQLEELERAEEKIRRTLPHVLNETSGSAK